MKPLILIACLLLQACAASLPLNEADAAMCKAEKCIAVSEEELKRVLADTLNSGMRYGFAAGQATCKRDGV